MQDFQDGQTKNIGGVTYTRQGGVWQAGGAPQAGPVYGAPVMPKEPTPQTPAQAQSDDLTVEDKTYKVQSQPVYDRSNAIDKVRDGVRQDKRILSYESAVPIWASALKSPETPEGDILLVNAFAKVNDPSTGVQQREGDSIQGAAPRLEQLKANLLKQFGTDGYGGFSPEGRKRLRQAITVRMERLTGTYRQARNEYRDYIKSLGLPDVDPETIIGPHAGTPFQQDVADVIGRPVKNADGTLGPAPQTQLAEAPSVGGFANELPTETLTKMSPEQTAQFYKIIFTPGATGEQLNDYVRSTGAGELKNADEIIETLSKGGKISDTPAYAKPDLSQIRQGDEVVDPIARGAADALTLGLSEELAAGVDTLTGDKSYNQNLDFHNAVRDYDEENNFGKRLAGQFAGGVVLPMGSARSAGGLAKVGAGYGAGYGAGSTDGGFVERGMGALTGFAAGAGAGYVAGKGAELVGRGAAAVGRRIAGPIDDGQREILRAGAEEGVDINMSDVLPQVRNTVATLETIPGASGPVRKGIQKGADQIEGRVQTLGAGGQALEDNVAGSAVQRTADRYIKTSGAQFGKQYDALEKAAGGAKVPATNSAKRVDEVITGLSELGETNKAEIAYLKGLKTDLGKDLSIGALRKLRTTLRKKIAKGELTFGEDEANVLSVMDAASEDIASGLAAQGKRGVAAQFAKTDRGYRDRMEFIRGTVQRVVGKRDANLSPEKVLQNLRGLASPKGGDEAAFGRFLNEMDADDRADIAATFADALGKNNKGVFTIDQLARQAEKMPKAVRAHVFGADGAKSLQNLITLSNAKSSTVASLNNSRSGQVGNYRTVMSSVLFGMPGGGALLGLAASAPGTGAAAGAVLAGIGLAVSRGVAKVLMNEEFTRALMQAPNTVNPKAINAHMGRLRKIAAKDVNARQFVEELEKKLLNFANDNLAGRSAAEGEDDEVKAKP